MPTQRNPVVRHSAILRKGGLHTKSVSGTRHQSRRQLDDEIDEYFDEIESSSDKTSDESINNQKSDKGRSKSAPSSLRLPNFYCLSQYPV